MATCLEYATSQVTACTSWGQTSRSTCTTWGTTTRTTCTSWGFFAFLCLFFTTVVEAVCLVGEIIVEAFCLLWATSVVVTCIVWEAVVTVATAVFDVIEAVLGWVFSLVASLADLVFSIPYVGRVLKTVWNLIITALVTAPVTLVEGVLYAIGLRTQKKLRVCTIIARDEKGTPIASTAAVIALLNDTIAMYRNRLNIQILNSAPGQFTSGFSSTGPAADEAWIRTTAGPWTAAELDGACSGSTIAGHTEDLTATGASRQFAMIGPCFFGAWRRLTGFGAPVTIFVQRSIGGGLFIGCALGPFTDYLTLAATFTPGAVDANVDDMADTVALAPGEPSFTPPPSPNNLLAHELGHKCNLLHETDPTNLMSASASSASGLTDLQVILVRGSRHVSYF